MSTARAPAGGISFTTTRLDPGPDLIDLLADPAGIVWSRGGEGFVAWGQAAAIEVGRGPGRFKGAWEALGEVFAAAEVHNEVGGTGTGPLAFGGFTFDEESGGSWLVIPEVVIGSFGDRRFVTRASGPLPPRPGQRKRIRRSPAGEVPEEEWLLAVKKACEAIAAGSLDKVVLARQVRVDSPAPIDPRAIARRLSARFPQCYCFAGAGMVGASPELLVGVRGAEARSEILAGSAPRGSDPAEDQALAEELAASPKQLQEHAFAVEGVRAALAPVAASLASSERPELFQLANVQHLSTTVVAGLKAPISSIELAGMLHPTAAVCGFPAGAAIGMIRSLEGFDRGLYGGPVGWVDAGGEGDWAIALRCAEIDGSSAHLFAGAGILEGSDPQAELEETRLKLAAMLEALGE